MCFEKLLLKFCSNYKVVKLLNMFISCFIVIVFVISYWTTAQGVLILFIKNDMNAYKQPNRYGWPHLPLYVGLDWMFISHLIIPLLMAVRCDLITLVWSVYSLISNNHRDKNQEMCAVLRSKELQKKSTRKKINNKKEYADCWHGWNDSAFYPQCKHVCWGLARSQLF